MTDIRNAGEAREVLFTTTPAATLTGIAREILLTTPTALTMTAIVREILLVTPPPPAGPRFQASVSVNVGTG